VEDILPIRIRGVIKIVSLVLVFLPCVLSAQDIVLRGRVVDPQGNALPNATVQIADRNQVVARTKSAADGKFLLQVRSTRELTIKVDAPGFRSVSQPVSVRAGGNSEIVISLSQLASHFESVTVTADVNGSDVLSPDPGEKVFVRQDLLDANPGRPGAPVSIPGYPIETASSGIKAPQYFAPGVAGDHGEPIAQYVAVGSYLVPNNLSANAHGNGYSRTYLFRRFWKAFKSMAGRLTFGKGITPSTSQPPTDFDPA
jgi:Carboxypeptidase regulatory-like domain